MKPGASRTMAPGVGLNFPRGITVATKGVVQLANYLFGVALDVKAWTCPAPPLPCGDSNEIHRVGGGFSPLLPQPSLLPQHLFNFIVHIVSH